MKLSGVTSIGYFRFVPIEGTPLDLLETIERDNTKICKLLKDGAKTYLGTAHINYSTLVAANKTGDTLCYIQR